MVSTFTPNVQIEEPARGDDVGTWDTPVNNNMTLIDLIVGGIATISLNNSNVILNAAQFECREIIFNSTLTGSVTITFPTSFKKSYEIFHTCTGSSAFTITLATTAAGGQVICAAPGEIVECVNDGTSLKYKNLGRVGSYMDFAGSSVPNWISGCTVAPYLNCDGTAFSSATFPQLATILGGTTLPDSLGRIRAALNQGTARMSSGQGGINGNTFLAGGGTDGVVLTVSQIPNGLVGNNSNNFNVNVTGTVRSLYGGDASGSIQVGGAIPGPTAGSGPTYATGFPSSGAIGSGTISIQITNTGNAVHSNTQPTYMGGLTLIRSG